MVRLVLDSSAILTIIHDEEGADLVWGELEGAAVSAVNLAEVISKMVEHGKTGEEASDIVGRLPIEVAPVDRDLAIQIGALRAATRHLGLSLGDRACLALGRRLGLPVLTCDRPWASLDLDMEIRLVR